MSNNNEHKTDFKKTTLGWIPIEWAVQRFDIIFELLSTNSFSRENLSDAATENNIQNIHYGDIHTKFNNAILDCANEKLPYIKDELIIKQQFNFIQEGDLIIADASEDYAGIGECVESINVGEKKIVSGLHTFLARDNSGLTIKGFRTYLFSNVKVNIELKKIATGISVYSISKANLKKFKLVIPTLPEQRKIAAILSTWDEANTKTQQLIVQLQQRNKGLMQELLTGKKRVKEFAGKWNEIVLSECLNYTPREVPKPTQSFFALGIRSHAKGIFHKNDFEPEGLAMEVLYEVKENDLVVNITFAWEQAIAIAGKKDNGGLVSHRFPTYTFITKNAEVEFFRYFIIQKSFKYLLDLISPGGAGRNRVMSKKEFLQLKVTIPDVEEQKAIANILNAASTELKIQEQKLAALQLQKKGLMQKLLTGELRVKIDGQ